nr:Ataxin-1 and HBP1 module (AXH) domain containing protein [Haemonchus contortus]
MNGDGQQQPGPSNTLPWTPQPALADILAALQMQLARNASEANRMVVGQPPPSTVLSAAAAAAAAAAANSSPLVSPLQPPAPAPQFNAIAAAAAAAAAATAGLASPTPLAAAISSNPLLHSYQQLLNPAFLELQRQLIAQQTAQFRVPFLPPQMASSMSLPTLRQQMSSQMPQMPPMPGPAGPTLPARPVPRKPSIPTVPGTAGVSATSPTTSTRINGSQFAVPHDPAVRKVPFPQCRPSTSAEMDKPAIQPKSPEFEMGKMPTNNYIPSHFMKGTLIQMANGKLKKVEDMSSDDFLLAAPLSKEFNVDASVVLEISKATTLARVKFAVGQTQYEAVLEPQLEYPFFVLGKGWSSCDPHRSAETYGLECQQLKVGDVCISLTRRTEEDAKQLDQTVTLAEASELKDKEATKAAVREQLSKDMTASDGRSSEPPNRYHPYAKKMRKVSES